MVSYICFLFVMLWFFFFARTRGSLTTHDLFILRLSNVPPNAGGGFAQLPVETVSAPQPPLQTSPADPTELSRILLTLLRFAATVITNEDQQVRMCVDVDVCF